MRPLNGERSGVGAVFNPEPAHLSCDQGYTHLLSGAFSEESDHLTQECQATGHYVEWGSEVSVRQETIGSVTASRLNCIPVQCTRPESPTHWQWLGSGNFDTKNPATLECEPGYSANGMEHGVTMWNVNCEDHGSHAALPQPCVPITHRIQCQVEDAVTAEPLSHAEIVVTDADGNEETRSSGAEGVWSIDHVRRGTVTISVTKDMYTTMEYSVDLQSDFNLGDCKISLNPHLDAHSWRAVLTWGARPRDLDSHVTRHPGSNEQSLGECPCSTRNHMSWMNVWAGTSGLTYWRYAAVSLDRDNVKATPETLEDPETTTFFRLDSCEYDCKFVFRVWDYCSLNQALEQESEGLVRLYNAEGLHSTYRVGTEGLINFDDYGRKSWDGTTPLYENRWDVFQIDASGGTPIVEDCSSGNCPDDLVQKEPNHFFCY